MASLVLWLCKVVPTKNRAAGAKFQQKKCGGCSIWIGRTWAGRGTLGLMGWEVGNERCARREVVPSQNPKLNRRALDLLNQMWAGLFSGRGDPIGVEYSGFEVVGASDWAWREGHPSWSQNPKPNRRGSVLANQTWRYSISGREDPTGVENTAFEVVGASDWASREGGGWLEPKAKN